MAFTTHTAWNQRQGRDNVGIIYYARANNWQGYMPLIGYNVAYNMTSSVTNNTTTISNILLYNYVAAFKQGALGLGSADVQGSMKLDSPAQFRLVAYGRNSSGTIVKQYEQYRPTFDLGVQHFDDGKQGLDMRTLWNDSGFSFTIPHSSYDGTLEDICLCFFYHARFDVADGDNWISGSIANDWNTLDQRRNNHPSYTNGELNGWFVWHINPRSKAPPARNPLSFTGWDTADYQDLIQINQYNNNFIDDLGAAGSLSPKIASATVSDITRNSFQINWSRTINATQPTLGAVGEAQIKLAKRGSTFIAGSSTGWLPLKTGTNGTGSTNVSSLSSGSFVVNKTAQPTLTEALENWTDYNLTLRFAAPTTVKESLRYATSIDNKSLQTQWGTSILPTGPRVPMLSNTSIRPSINFTIDSTAVTFDPAMVKRIKIWVTQFGSTIPIGNQIDVSNNNWTSKFLTNTISGISGFVFDPKTTISWPTTSIGTGQYQLHAQIQTGEYDRIGSTRPLNPQNGSENWQTMTPVRFMASTGANIKVRGKNNTWQSGNPIFIDTACQHTPAFALIQRWSHSSAFTTSFKGWVSYPSSGSGTAILRTKLFHLDESHSIVFGFQTASSQQFTCRVFDMNGNEYFHSSISDGTTPKPLKGTQADYIIPNVWGTNIYYVIFEHVGGSVSETGRVAITKLRVGKFATSAPYLPEAGGTLVSSIFNAPANGKLVITNIRRTGLGRTVVTYGDKTKSYYNIEASTVDVDRPNYQWVSSNSEISETITFKKAGLYRLVECCGSHPDIRDLDARVTCNNAMVLNGSTVIPMSPWWNIADSFYRTLANPSASISGTTPISNDPMQVARIEVYGNGKTSGSSELAWVQSSS